MTKKYLESYQNTALRNKSPKTNLSLILYGGIEISFLFWGLYMIKDVTQTQLGPIKYYSVKDLFCERDILKRL